MSDILDAILTQIPKPAESVQPVKAPEQPAAVEPKADPSVSVSKQFLEEYGPRK